MPYDPKFSLSHVKRTVGNAPLEYHRAVTAADIVRNLCRELFVVQQEKINFPHVVDEEFLEAVGEEMACLNGRNCQNKPIRRNNLSCLLVAAITNLRVF